MFRTNRIRLVLVAGLTVGGGIAAAQPARGPGAVTAVARVDTSAATAEVYYFDLDRGEGFAIDPSRRDPTKARARRLEQNLFALIGRPADQPARAGEMLMAPIVNGDGSVRSAILVETSTGYVAYFDQLGKGGRFGEIATSVGRPFGDLAAADGNFALLLRRGRDEAAILYHASTGRALALLDAGQQPSRPEVVAVASLPAMTGRVASVTLARGLDATDGFLLVDGGSGTVYRVGLDARGLPAEPVELSFGLFDSFPREVEASPEPRFGLVPVAADGGRTRHVLVIDLGSGKTAWLANADGAFAPPTLQALDDDWGRYFSTGGSPPRPLGVVPHTGLDGATQGAWLIDGPTGRILYVDHLDRPQDLAISPVALDR